VASARQGNCLGAVGRGHALAKLSKPASPYQPISNFHKEKAASYAAVIGLLYMPQALLGASIYLKSAFT